MSHEDGHMSKYQRHRETRRINLDRKHPGDFGEVSMRRYHYKGNQNFCPTVSLNKLWILVSEQIQVNAPPNRTRDAPIIDVVQSGWENVLGKGELLKSPVLKIKFFSRRASESKWRSLVSWFEATWSSLNANRCFKRY